MTPPWEPGTGGAPSAPKKYDPTYRNPNYCRKCRKFIPNEHFSIHFEKYCGKCWDEYMILYHKFLGE